MSLAKVKELVNILSENNLQEIDFEDDKIKVRITKNICSNNIDIKNDNSDYIKSPLVGTYFSSSPKVVVGEKVKKGQVVCIINAMKIMNEITAPYDGIIKDIKFSDNDSISVDDDLMLIEKI